MPIAALARGGTAGFDGDFGGKYYYFLENGESYFYDFGTIGYYWTATRKDHNNIISYTVRGTDNTVLRESITERSMISVRCVRNR